MKQRKNKRISDCNDWWINQYSFNSYSCKLLNQSTESVDGVREMGGWGLNSIALELSYFSMEKDNGLGYTSNAVDLVYFTGVFILVHQNFTIIKILFLFRSLRFSMISLFLWFYYL